MNDAWFDPNSFGAYYGAIGGVGGLLGGCFGALAGLLVPKRKGRRWVMGSMVVAVVFGIVLLLFGVVALLCAQPYGIWYPPTLCGLIITIVFSVMIPVIRKRYEQHLGCAPSAQTVHSE